MKKSTNTIADRSASRPRMLVVAPSRWSNLLATLRTFRRASSIVPLYVKVVPFYAVIVFLVVLNVSNVRERQAHVYAAQSKAELRLSTSNEGTPSGGIVIRAGAPTRLIVPEVSIDVPVVLAAFNINKNAWPVAASQANFATSSVMPNNVAGKTFVYGHRIDAVFRPLHDAKVGTVAYVYSEDGHTFKYRLSRTAIVEGSDGSVLKEFDGEPGLILMTCAGPFDGQRLILYWQLEEAA